MRLRFKLKTALWAMAVIALLFSYWAVKRREFRAIDRIFALGGLVLFESEGHGPMPDEPALPFNSPGPSMLTQFCADYIGIVVGDSARYAYVRGYPEPLTDSTVEGMNLRVIRSLQGISFSDTPVGDATVDKVCTLSGLRELALRNTRITSKSRPSLARMRSLEKLDVRATYLRREDVAFLEEALPDAEILSDYGNSRTD